MKFKQKPEINASAIPCDKEFLEKKFLLQADMPASSKDNADLAAIPARSDSPCLTRTPETAPRGVILTQEAEPTAQSCLHGNSTRSGQKLPGTAADLDKNTSWRQIPVSKETVVFSLRLPKKDMQQLKYISKYLGISVNGICLSAVQANNKKILKEIEENL